MRLEHSPLGALTIVALLVTSSHARSAEPTATPAAPEQQQASPPTIQYPSHLSAGHSAPPAGVLTNPYKGDKDMAAAGEGLFSSMNCDGCHGGGATGFAAPSLADGRWRYGGSEEEIFQSIFYGRPKGMPAFGGALGPNGTWILVTYLKSLSVPDNVPTQSWEAHSTLPVAAVAAAQSAAAPTPASAEGLLKRYACLACHSANARVVGPSYKGGRCEVSRPGRCRADARREGQERRLGSLG
jgi:cytochrome c oxidase cbb3-type subunit 3